MEKKWKTKEVVVIAMVAAVVGVLYTLMDYAYMPLAAVLGSVFMELTFGIYLLSAALPMYIVRKPGFAIYGALVTAGVNLLLGSPYGIQLILAGLLQAIGIEIAYAIYKYDASIKCMTVGAILAALLVFSRDCYFFGTLTLGTNVVLMTLAVRLLSATVIGTLLVKLITKSLRLTGAFRGFACTGN